MAEIVPQAAACAARMDSLHPAVKPVAAGAWNVRPQSATWNSLLYRLRLLNTLTEKLSGVMLIYYVHGVYLLS